MKKLGTPSSVPIPGKPGELSPEYWFDDACVLDMDYFVKTLAGIKSKGVRPDLIGSIIAHYASKWLPDLAGDDYEKGTPGDLGESSPESVTSSWMKKRFFVETLVGVLPPEKDSVSCNFLLRLLRISNMVGLEPTYLSDLEKRISWQLDQASLKELMIPAFSHTCATLLDVELVIRIVKRFVNLEESSRNGDAMIKVAKLVECYLAEAALDSNLSSQEFLALAGALPSHSRATDDGLYRAIDTYIKAHPGISKQEKKALCRLIDSRKLSPEASLHAAQNERLPVRLVIQVLFGEQIKLYRRLDWSGSFSGLRSSSPSTRHQSKCEISIQQIEIKKLKEEVHKLQSQCYALQVQMDRLLEKKKGFFRWKKLGSMTGFKSIGVVGKSEEIEAEGELGFGRQTPNMKTKLVKSRGTSKWR